ncbi:MAG: FHIPEP family type III secretion protein [Treponema sp.]|nr:FHIPEP family type III secretion protein [Treponema sp.]
MKYEEKFTPDTSASILNSCVLFCDLVIVGSESAIGLKYDEENMFAPMIVFLEKDAAAEALVRAAENLGVSIVSNSLLAKNLISYGKAGEAIPEASYRDVSMALSRSVPHRSRPRRSFGKGRQSIPVKVPRPLSVELGASFFALTAEEPGRDVLLGEPLNALRKKLIRLLGFSIPAVRISLNSKLRDDEYRILFKGLEAGRGRLELGCCAGIDFQDIQLAAKTASSVLVRHAAEIIQRRAAELLGRDEVEAILDAAEEKYPVVTGEAKSLLSLGIIRDILQSLVSEQVSIRHIAVILETLADWGSFGPAPSDMVIEQIRQSLKRQICLEYTDDRQCLRVLTLDPKLDKEFADHSLESRLIGAESPSNSCPEDRVNLISSALQVLHDRGFPPVILCSPKARFLVKEATRRKVPELAVLSYLEIPADINIEPLGEIRLEGNVRVLR